LDEIFDALIQNRTAQARALGFDSYTDYRYATRFGYGRREIERFRAQVRKTLVPLVSEIKNRQRERLGVETFRIYDSPVRFADGNPKLKVKRAAFVEAVAEIFDALSPDAGGYFRKLRARGMLDLFDRRGKIPYAGFCLNLPEYGADVICARFSGDQSDFEILTHEFGHAYSSHRAAAAGVRLTQQEMPQEIAETHAKAMELFTMDGAEKVFDEADAKRYAIKQLEYIPYFITSICAGDEFQHALYDNPDMTPAERNAAYAEIYAQYNPYLDLSDLPFESWGSQWQDTLVIYSMPFYYIDYALAQVLALALYRESRDDFGAAWARYQRFVDGAGTRALPDLAAHCGIPSPFADGAIEDAGALIRRELGKLY
jgi:M3 family oligoendopeptidase